MTMPWWRGGPEQQVQLVEDKDGFGLVVQNGEDSIRVALQMVELVFLGDALGVIKDRWINTHMEDVEYEFADN
tara:strand:+ start:430 stop:648 length:219 start_codon:yes stop_codon:yes gene_type:complete